jgi:PAS domain S-box-containing protein
MAQLTNGPWTGVRAGVELSQRPSSVSLQPIGRPAAKRKFAREARPVADTKPALTRLRRRTSRAWHPIFSSALASLSHLRVFIPRKWEWLWAVVPALGYFIGAELAFAVGTLSNLFAPLWPPNAILLCVLTLAPYRLWWLCLASTLPPHALAETMAGMDGPQWLGAFLCNAAVAVGGAVSLRTAVAPPRWLGSLANAWAYILLVAIGVPGAVAVAIAGAGIATGSTVGDVGFAIRWFLANLVGMLTLAPLLLTWFGQGADWLRDVSRQDMGKAALVAVAVIVTAWLSFAFVPYNDYYPALACTVIPALLWATAQFGARGASAAVFVATVAAIGGAMRGLGPFVSSSPDQSIQSLQLFLAVMSPPFLILGAVVEERQRTLTDVTVAEHKLQSILDNTPACISARDPSGRYILANRMARSQAPLPSEFVGKTSAELFPPLVADALRADDEEAAQSGQPITKEVTVQFVDQARTFLTSKFALRDAHDRLYALCTIATDITEGKRSREALEASEARFRVMAETVPAILFMADRHGRWEYANERFFDYTGLTSGTSELNWLELIHPDDMPRVRAAWRRSTAMGALFEQEVRIRSSEGNYSWFVARCRPIRDVSGHIERWFGAAAEIDDLKVAENELRRGNALQAAILEGISDQYFALDETLRVTALNPKAAAAAGLKSNEAMGRSFLEVYPHFNGTRLAWACRRVLRRRMAMHLEIQLQSPESGWLDVNIYPFDGGISVFSRDISERKKTERTLQELSSKLLTSQDEERRRIARELHDGAAQYITAVKLNLELFLRGAAAMPEDQRRHIEESLSFIEMTLSEIRTLSYWLHPPMLDEVGLVSALQWYTDGFTKRSEIEIDLQTYSDVGRLGTQIETALFRVVQECLGNVHRHSGADKVVLSLSRTPSKIVLTITDNGRGIPINFATHDPADVKLLGVGIAGMSSRLKQLGGRLDIVSHRRGTTVRATVPRAEIAEIEAHDQDELLDFNQASIDRPAVCND